MSGESNPIISVVILNYNGRAWIERCLESLRAQTLEQAGFEIVFADNSSTDGSDLLAETLLRSIPNGRFVQNGANLGFCEGNNRAAHQARGEYLFFLNNDAWLEPECLETLVREVRRHQADAASPLILNYDDNSFQSIGAEGFDIFGLPSARRDRRDGGPVLMPEGCAYFIRAKLFHRLGGFDPEFFMYSDEYDLSWRVWIEGSTAIRVPGAVVHHRGAANVNPAGGGTVVEFRTSDTKRYYANRNALMVLLKNCGNILLAMALLQVLLLALEALVALVLIRRWSFVRRAYWDALVDCYHLRDHISRERARIAHLRRRGDFGMFRFLTWRLNRWDELKRMVTFGVPKVAAK